MTRFILWSELQQQQKFRAKVELHKLCDEPNFDDTDCAEVLKHKRERKKDEDRIEK
jgi:hypothetical protein